MKQAINFIIWIFLYVLINPATRQKIQTIYRSHAAPPVREHRVGADLCTSGPFPALTPSLMRTIIWGTGVILSMSLAITTAGYPGALFLPPIFIAYVYAVLFIQTLLDAAASRRQVNQ